MEGHVAPYLKEVGLAGNLPGQFQGTYIRCCVFTCVCTILEQTAPRVGCTSLFKLAMSFLILHEQLRRHQFLVHSQTCHDIFAVRVVRV